MHVNVLTERKIDTHLQKDVTHSQTTILLSHAPTAYVLHSQCAAIDSAHQCKAQPTTISLGELHLQDTALQEEEQRNRDI